MIRLYSKNPKVVFTLFAFVCVILTFTALTNAIARREVGSFLNDVALHTISARPPKKPDILIQGKPDGKSVQTLVALQRIAVGHDRHSHPTDVIDIRVRDNERSLHLILKRDSYDRQEYWIFCPDFWYVLSDIGRLQTNAFDEYWIVLPGMARSSLPLRSSTKIRS